MARFELHKTFVHPTASERRAASDRFSEVVAAWERERDVEVVGEGFAGYVVINTAQDTIVWRAGALFAPAPVAAGGEGG